jgi:hypothetical protein
MSYMSAYATNVNADQPDNDDVLFSLLTLQRSQIADTISSSLLDAGVRQALSVGGDVTGVDDDLLLGRGSFSTHSPHVRSIFYDLKNKLHDLDAIYGVPSEFDEAVRFVPTEEHIGFLEKLEHSVGFFKDEMYAAFERYALAQKCCNEQQMEFRKYRQLVEMLEAPHIETQPFQECAGRITSALKALTEHMDEKQMEAMRSRDQYWAQYCGLRSMCSKADGIEADPICKMCYSMEIDTALNCGHTMCGTCASQIVTCPTCRVNISQKLHIFI